MSLTKRDVRNELGKDKKLQLKDGDADAMIKYFSKMTSGNQNFFHACHLDATGQIQEILWVDARSQVAYKDLVMLYALTLPTLPKSMSFHLRTL